ncbi:MAG: patatin-like phospholipase family protein [Cytophagales bacterium]|nr:patatin-like phospholipase family protein [Cytophagales bacterium]
MNDVNDPLSSIGLCFSGGGYRAAAFSLGVLSYLHRIHYEEAPLLEQVEALSTVSGGTITGVCYAHSTYTAGSFEDFYSAFYRFLDEDLLLEKALNKLEDHGFWKGIPKKRSLINAFASAYEEMLPSGTFKAFDRPGAIHLKDVCFNATDFAYGLAFRFQNSGYFGNKPLYSPTLNTLKGNIRLSDVIASSSCFPFGFEPMIFPDDYFGDHTSEHYRELKQKEKYRHGIGLMDGGIVDNQGIGSMVNIDKRRKSPLGTIIVCDVGSYNMDQWEQAADSKGTGKPGKTLNRLLSNVLRLLKFKWYYWGTALAGVLLVGLNSMNLFFSRSWDFLYVAGGLLTGVGLVLMVIGSFTTLLRAGIKIFMNNLYQKNVPKELVDDVATFQKLDIALVRRMLAERLTSAVTMISEVFLNQIRRLNYRLLYEKEAYKHRAVTSTVYQLNGVKSTLGIGFKPNQGIRPSPSPKIQESSLIASQMPTTLWWDDDDRSVNRLENLIACGQFTTCYNLMDYILTLKNSGVSSAALDKLFDDLHEDWKEFNNSPRKFV